MIRRANLMTILLLLLAGCATTAERAVPPEAVVQQQAGKLEDAIAALDESVDPGEAQRAAVVAFAYSNQLAQEYEITTSPLMHNLLVNMGIKSRGLCIHWTEDLLLRLQQENFHSLDLHWAIANHDTSFSLEHSTVVISARGDSLYRGLVLDPWRDGGRLFWAYTLQDRAYPWQPQAQVHADKRERLGQVTTDQQDR